MPSGRGWRKFHRRSLRSSTTEAARERRQLSSKVSRQAQGYGYAGIEWVPCLLPTCRPDSPLVGSHRLSMWLIATARAPCCCIRWWWSTASCVCAPPSSNGGARASPVPSPSPYAAPSISRHTANPNSARPREFLHVPLKLCEHGPCHGGGRLPTAWSGTA